MHHIGDRRICSSCLEHGHIGYNIFMVKGYGCFCAKCIMDRWGIETTPNGEMVIVKPIWRYTLGGERRYDFNKNDAKNMEVALMPEQKTIEVYEKNEEEVSENFENKEYKELDRLERKPTQAGAKPDFDKIVLVKVKTAVFRTDDKPAEDSKNRKYYPFWLSITFDFGGNEIFENYGGGRRYEDTDWIGTKSALGNLRELIRKSFDYDETLKHLVDLLLNKMVGVISEDRNGRRKIMIKHFA